MTDSATPRYAFTLPAFDTLPWHDKVNNNFRKVEALIYSSLNAPSIEGVWTALTAFEEGQRVYDYASQRVYECLVDHTSGSTTLAQDIADHPTYWAIVWPGVVPRGAWTTATLFRAQDLVTQDGNVYMCEERHTSGVFSTDLAAGKWTLWVEKGASGNGTGDVVGPGSAVDGHVVLFNGTTGKILKTSSVALSALATLANPTFTGTVTIPTPTAGDNTTKAASTAFVVTAINNAVSALLNGVDSAYDTLAELATALVNKVDTATYTAGMATKQAASALLSSIAGLSIAAGDILYASGASTFARLAKGNNGQVLSLVAGLPAWTNANFTFITELTASGPTVSLTDIAAGYKHLLIIVDGVTHNSAGDAGLILGLSSNNGSLYQDNTIVSALNNDAADLFSGAMFVFGAGESSRNKIGLGAWVSGVSNGRDSFRDSTTTGVVNAIQFKPTADSFDGGKFYVYGVS